MKATPSQPVIGHPFIELSVVDSTNNYAMRQVSRGEVTEGTVYFAYGQTAGKGQRGKAWHAEPGENMILSLVLRPEMLRPGDQFLLSAIIALSALDFWKKYAGKAATIKWSNDLYWNDKKAGGILIENVLRGNTWQYAIVGIGLNINTRVFPDALPNPVSLQQITGRTWDIRELSLELCGCIERRYVALHPDQSDAILAAYQRALYRFGIPAQYRGREGVFTAVIRDVQPDGKLVMEKDGQMVAFDFGEIEFIIT